MSTDFPDFSDEAAEQDYTRASGSGEAHPNDEMITIDFMFTVPARNISVIRQATGYSVH